MMCWAVAYHAEAGTVAWWRFETDNGGPVVDDQTVVRVDDVSGNDHHLFPTDGGGRYGANLGAFPDPLPLLPHVSNHFYFTMPDGGGGFALTNANFTGLQYDTTFTIEAFFRRTGPDGGLGRAIFDNRPSSGPNGLRLDLEGADVNGINQLRIVHAGHGSVTTTNAGIILGKTYHVAYIRSNTMSYVYLDGGADLGDQPRLRF